MATVHNKLKRTYNLTPAAVRSVQVLAKESHLSQDAVVEHAIQEAKRAALENAHGKAWAAAGKDPAFQSELAETFSSFLEEDRTAWE